MTATVAGLDVAAQLGEAARLVRLDSGGAVVSGQRWQGPPGSRVDAVAQLLYATWYVQASPPRPATGPVGAWERNLLQALRAAHAGSERFAGGWRAAQVSTRGRVRAVPGRQAGQPAAPGGLAGQPAVEDAAATGEHPRVLDRSQYVVPARPGLRAEPGDELLVTRRHDHADDHGFWITHLGAWPPPGGAVLARLYWHVAPAGAAPLTRRLTALLLDAGVPATLKVVGDPAAFGRADAAVTYLPRGAFAELRAGLRATADALRPHLADPPPRLTRRLAPGVGVAESTLEGPSFGQRRCRLVAEGLERAHRAGVQTPAGRVDAVRGRLAEAGLDPDRPHLAAPPAPGARDRYAW